MRRIIVLCAAIVASLTASCAVHHAIAPAPPPPMGTITYDSQCFTIDGKDTFLYSGSLHYFRCPKPLWQDRLQRMKDAGMNCVETYVPWNWHEQNMPSGLDDYSQIDMSDLTDFLDIAINKVGLYVILRPGPYICAEWDGGGYPQWLTTKRPANITGNWLRGDDATYLAWSKHWINAVAKATVPYQITHEPAGKPGVILWQIENEYNYATGFTAQVKLNQLLALAHDARDDGIDVPLITCMTDSPLFQNDPYLKQNVIECRNTYPRFSPTGELRDLLYLDRYQTDKPRLVTELQGGWFSEIGKNNKLSADQGYNGPQIDRVTLTAWAHGFTGTNYYMMYGGTNFGDWGSAMKTTSYDYAAPIREWGGVGERYFAVEGMAAFLKDHSSQLVRAVEEKITATPASSDLQVTLRRAADGSRFLFIINNQVDQPLNGQIHIADPMKMDVDYDLKPFDAKVLFIPANTTDQSQATWYPTPAAPPARPQNVPAAQTITDARWQAEPIPPADSWKDLPDGASLEDMGIYDRRFVFYRAQVSQPAGTDGPLSIQAHLPQQDSFLAQQDDKPLAISSHGAGLIGGKLLGNTGDLLVLFENGGRENIGNIDAGSGLLDAGFLTGSVLPTSIANWKFKLESDGTTTAPSDDIAVDLDDSTWATPTLTSRRPDQVPAGRIGVFRAHFDLTDEDVKAADYLLSLGTVRGDRQVFVNGQEISSDSNKIPVGSVLKAGPNTIVLVISSGDAIGGMVGATQLVSDKAGTTTPIHWQISSQTAGIAGKWWDPDLDDSSWNAEKVGPIEDPPGQNSPINLVWHRINFQLPDQDPHIWVPWKLHLAASGNGFIYLNGHNLGRWWEVGPQSDFYLPECWLNFGAGKKNVIALCLRPTSGPTGIISAEVGPYADFAEVR